MSKVTYPHRSRADMVKYITGIGGYSDRFHRWPIEFTVGVYISLSMNTLWADEFLRENLPDALEPDKAEDYRRLADEYLSAHEESLWINAIEDAQRGVKEDDFWQAEFSFVGRGGKHLVLDSLMGYTLRGMDEDGIESDLLEYETPGGCTGYAVQRWIGPILTYGELPRGCTWVVPIARVRELYRMLRQMEAHFTSDNAGKEVTYLAASSLMSIVSDKYEELLQERRATAELIESVSAVYSALPYPVSTTLHEHMQKIVRVLGLPSNMLDEITI